MSLESCQPLNQADLTRLDQFLRTNSCGQEAMGLSYTHGLLTAIASGPECLESEKWLRLVFDEAVFESGKKYEEELILAMHLFGEIEHKLKTNVGFRPIFDNVHSAENHRYADAQSWCLGFTDGLKLFSECWTEEASNTLRNPLALIFQLADMPGVPGATYSKICDKVSDAAEYIYCFWQKANLPK